MNLKQLTKEYATLLAKENAIKAQREALSGKIREGIKKIGGKQFGATEGLFTIYEKAKWTFSKKVYVKEEEVDTLKEKEKESGVAKATFVELIRFTPKKND